MQQGEGDSVDARSEDGREVEAFKLPLSEENVALGRLGRIYKALDRKSGRMLAVECIDVVDESEDEGEENSPAEFVQQTLATELGRCLGVINGDNARHVFCYDAVSCGRSRVYLCASSSVVRSLAVLHQDFGRLHPLAVKQYIYQIVHGLRVLHEYGISCGGLSLSSLLLCGGNIVKIAAWFPSTQAVRAFQTRNILVDSSFSLPLGIDEMAQDVRSVAIP
ncbi:serine/threonine protein kinase [Phytophthora cinnamomi]|uniref:serine/threonine protein kinase n=1 Tax=Phytophthora cinnamomi TaxID=4785 RepID=UPI00355AAB70|nr:serine/threonine protein kinase [Phytophthora cinnamomi]